MIPLVTIGIGVALRPMPRLTARILVFTRAISAFSPIYPMKSKSEKFPNE